MEVIKASIITKGKCFLKDKKIAGEKKSPMPSDDLETLKRKVSMDLSLLTLQLMVFVNNGPWNLGTLLFYREHKDGIPLIFVEVFQSESS